MATLLGLGGLLLGAACTSEPSATETPRPSASSEPTTSFTPVVTGTPGEPTATPEVIHVPEPDAEIAVGLDEANGIIAIDPATDEVHTIWAGERLWVNDVYPPLAARGDGLWLSWDNGDHESVRYNLEGIEVTSVPGIFARESPHGTVVTYCVFEGDWDTATLAIRYPYHIVELDEGCNAAVPRDDGRVLFFGPFVDGRQSVRLYDPATDSVVTAIDGVGRPGMDGVIYPTWSPGGRFVSDRSYIEGTPPRQEAWLFDTETGEQRSIEPYDAWIADPSGDWLASATESGTIRLSDPTGARPDIELVLEGRRLIGVQDLGGRVGVPLDDRDGGGFAVFGLNGTLEQVWEAGWYATPTTRGIVLHRLNGPIGCTGQEFRYPDRPPVIVEFPMICMGGGHLSPDGRFIAVREEGKPGGWIWIMDLETYRLTRFDLGRNENRMEWSADGTRLVVSLGGGT